MSARHPRPLPRPLPRRVERHVRDRRGQRGAALLAAMLTVTLVATIAAAALWRQWRAVEIEAAERGRVQAAWVLVGALDWSRLILREDGRTGGADHLAEPWAVPLEEAKLSTFLAAEKNVATDVGSDLPDAFLSGQITDAQAKLNVRNLVDGDKPAPAAVNAMRKLFELLGLPGAEVDLLVGGLQRARPGVTATTAAGAVTAGAAANAADEAPLMPQRTADLVWLGLSPSTIEALEPYVTVLPEQTALNVNTASAEALFASVPQLDMAGARRLVAQRQRKYFATLEEAKAALDRTDITFSEHAIATKYFEVRGRLRLDRIWVEEQSLVYRNGVNLSVIWRDRGAGATPIEGKP